MALIVQHKSRELTLEFGRAYVLHADDVQVASALSDGIAGRDETPSAVVTRDGAPYPPEARAADAWYVRRDEILRFGVFPQSVKRQIRLGLQKTRVADEAMIKRQFGLSDGRYGRLLRQFSKEGWRASCAIGYAHGKRIFCLIDPLPYLAEYTDFWLRDQIRFLCDAGALFLLTTATPATFIPLVDDVIDVG